MGGFDPWNGLVLLLLVAIPAAVILAMVWLLRRNRHALRPGMKRERAPLGTQRRATGISHATD
ncbi:hypothetical protein [Luteimonas sp. MHLX1A]|uniref:hypothetical protein n=1 Tax=Alterluteimonas muca TaxID=2878684 RepID=UPI001E4DAC52|nr:hypothetical protein [Luteimonas sp. MHLX1A]MCD9046393.1 hypothetical protein [Luteimonas sp. MHLX1A]